MTEAELVKLMETVVLARDLLDRKESLTKRLVKTRAASDNFKYWLSYGEDAYVENDGLGPDGLAAIKEIVVAALARSLEKVSRQLEELKLPTQ